MKGGSKELRQLLGPPELGLSSTMLPSGAFSSLEIQAIRFSLTLFQAQG